MASGSPAQLRMIEVAERLFAERGVNGVSLREIGAQADQRNTAAARYHFGSKAGLVDAIFEYRMGPINARRMAMIAELDRHGRGGDIRGLAAAYLFPLSDMLGEPGRPSWYLRFCVHAAFLEGTVVNDLGAQEWTEGMHIVKSRMETALGELPDAVGRERWSLFAGYVAHALADRELAIHDGRTASMTARPVFLAGLLDTAVALILAPVSEATRGELDADLTFSLHPTVATGG